MSDELELTEEEFNEKVKKQILLDKVRLILGKLDAITDGVLTDEFLALKVYQSPALNDVVSLIFDKALKQHELCEIYSRLCLKQVLDEFGSSGNENKNESKFRNALLQRAQDTFTTKNMDELVKEKKAEIDAESNEAEKEEMQIELLKEQNKFRKRKFGNIKFIGHLYLQKLISSRIILFCIVDLLESVTCRKLLDGCLPDEESVECAVCLLETIGKLLEEENTAADKQKTNEEKNSKDNSQSEAAFPLDGTFDTLQAAVPVVSERLGMKIRNLIDLRFNEWMPIQRKAEAVDLNEDLEDLTSAKLRKLEFENSQLQGAVLDMQIAMDAMRAAMAHLEQKNREVLDLIRRQCEKEEKS